MIHDHHESARDWAQEHDPELLDDYPEVDDDDTEEDHRSRVDLWNQLADRLKEASNA